MKMKILYIIPNLEIAGTEKHLINLISNLDSNRFEVCVCCIVKLGKLGDFFKKSGRNITCLNRRNIYDPRILLDIYRLIKRYKFDIVHTYLFSFHYLGIIPARLCGVPIIISSRRELATWKRWYHRFLENLGNKFTDKVIACSEAAREFSLQTENLSQDKIITIYNGINLKEFYPRPRNTQILNEFGFNETDNIIGMVTKFVEVKGHKTALEAIAKVTNVYSQIKCLLVGDGHLRKETEKRMKDLKLDKNVRFVGLRDDVTQILSIIDIFISTSLSESLPNTILEAMACGLPVVATNVGGIPEIVINAETGILVPSRDPSALAKAINILLENEQLREKMGQQGRKIVEEKFNLERMIKDYENLYEKLFYSKTIK